MASYNPNSGLQVAPDAKQYAPPHSTASQPYYAPQNGMGPQYYPQQTGGVHAEKTICGVRRPTFWLSFALIFVIISAGIGAGVGGGLAVQNVKKACKLNSNSDSDFDSYGDSIYATRTRTITKTLDSSTTTATATATATPTSDTITVPTSGILALDCPSLDQKSIQAFSTTFRVICGQDSSAPNLVAIVAYSILDCARACETYNENHVQGEGCVAATFNSNLAYVDAHKGTCWLKGQGGTAVVDGLEGLSPNSYAQIILQ